MAPPALNPKPPTTAVPPTQGDSIAILPVKITVTIKCKPKAPGYANTKDSAYCYRNANCPKASDIYIRHRIIVTIYEHIMTRDTLPCRCIAICTYKPANNGIIIATLQVIEPRLLVVHIATIPQRIQLRKLTGRCKNLAPGIVIVVCALHTIHGFEAYYIALQVGDVIIDLSPRSADLSNWQNSNIRTLPLVQCCRFTLLTSIFIPLL